MADERVAGERFAFDEDVWVDEVDRFRVGGAAHRSAVTTRAQSSGRVRGYRCARAMPRALTALASVAARRFTYRSPPSRRAQRTGSSSRSERAGAAGRWFCAWSPTASATRLRLAASTSAPTGACTVATPTSSGDLKRMAVALDSPVRRFRTNWLSI